MNWLKYLVGFSALIIAGCAAFFSVTGLGVLFSGASTAVMVMAGSLEFAKLVAATYLKQKWDEIQGFNCTSTQRDRNGNGTSSNNFKHLRSNI